MPGLAEILQRPDIWRGDTLAHAPLPGVPTGFPELDRELPGNGWPRSGLTEILPSQTGVGELSLLLPALALLSAEELAWLIFITPPYPLYGPALDTGGVALSRLLTVGAGRNAAWACERALDTEGVGAVVAWLPDATVSLLRRLQLAAEASRTLLFVFRPSACTMQSSPAPLRLALTGEGEHLQIRLLKRRGIPCAEPLSIAIQRPVRPRHALACPPSPATAARSARQPASA